MCFVKLHICTHIQCTVAMNCNFCIFSIKCVQICKIIFFLKSEIRHFFIRTLAFSCKLTDYMYISNKKSICLNFCFFVLHYVKNMIIILSFKYIFEQSQLKLILKTFQKSRLFFKVIFSTYVCQKKLKNLIETVCCHVHSRAIQSVDLTVISYKSSAVLNK